MNRLPIALETIPTPTLSPPLPANESHYSTDIDNRINLDQSIASPPQRQAIRFAETKGMSREQWLSIRKQGIGSSDAAAACGLNPHQSMLELWMIKTGRLQPNAEQIEANSYSPLYWGHQLEPLIASYYQQRTGNKVRRVNAVLQHADPDLAFMLANLDYRIVGNDQVHILECKSIGEWGAKRWKEGVPLYVLIQVQHQLAVTGKQAAHVCALICGHEAKIYKVERNEKVIEHIIASEQRFWECVKKDIPPSVDASESAARALQLLYPEHIPLETIDFTETPSMDQLFTELVNETNYLVDHQTKYDLLKHQIQAMMKQAERAVFRQGSVTWKRSKDATVLDHKALLKDQPELLIQYPQIRQGSRRFQVYPANRN